MCSGGYSLTSPVIVLAGNSIQGRGEFADALASTSVSSLLLADNRQLRAGALVAIVTKLAARGAHSLRTVDLSCT